MNPTDNTTEPVYYSGPPIVRPAQYVIVGYREMYVIVFAAPKYPERFSTRDDADRRAAQCGRHVRVEREAIYRRVTP